MATSSVLACARGQLECVNRWPTRTQAAIVISAKVTPATKRRPPGAQAAPARDVIFIWTDADTCRAPRSRGQLASRRGPRAPAASRTITRLLIVAHYPPGGCLALRCVQRPRVLVLLHEPALAASGSYERERDHEEVSKANARNVG